MSIPRTAGRGKFGLGLIADDSAVVRRPVRGDGSDIEAHRYLQALEAIAEDGHLTQRSLANRLGIALGLTNLYLRRLVRKGYVKCVNVQSNRLRYLLTPKGVTEKTRLTYEFMQYSVSLYGQVRQRLQAVLAPYALDKPTRVAVYGTGEAAELAYLSIAGLGLEMVTVFDHQPSGRFLGQPVRDIADHRDVVFDFLLVATLEPPAPIVADLVQIGIARERLVTLRQ